ncbi:MAG: dihydroxy-acid dehydratase, partial [Nannocystaceae bacterium]
ALELARSENGALKEVVTARALVNAIVGLHATGGSTNHTLHLVAIGRACGVQLTWDDFEALSRVVPLLCRVYPNGDADVNALAALGGIPFVLRELLGAGLLHEDVETVMGRGLSAHAQLPVLRAGEVHYEPPPGVSGDTTVLRGVAAPFAATGGLRVVNGNLGRAVVKVSSVAPAHAVVEAPVRVFSSQAAVREAFEAGVLEEDVVVVVRFQGPRANGMPELHKLTPLLSELQERGHAVALVTDGRMSGASGKVCAAIHLTPEAARGGLLAKLRDGDRVRVDATDGTLALLGDCDAVAARAPALIPHPAEVGGGRGLFTGLRRQISSAEEGASILFDSHERLETTRPGAGAQDGDDDG